MTHSDDRPHRTGDDTENSHRRLSPAAATVVVVLLAIPLIALALVPTYSRETPALWGFPFFYWYQFLWIVLTPILTYAAYLVIERARGRR